MEFAVLAVSQDVVGDGGCRINKFPQHFCIPSQVAILSSFLDVEL